MNYRDCEYNTSKSPTFVGYCDLPKYTTETGKRLVECKKCPCEDFKHNIHKDCENYSPKKDYCLKFFEENVSENYPVCKEYSEFNDKELSRKWSN